VLSLLLAQADAPAQSPLAGPGNMLFLVAIFFGIFYFMIIRPQQKQQKTHKSYLESLKKGDEVITNGGLIGRIAGVQGDVLTLEIANNVRVRVLKDQVNRPFVVKEPPAPAAEDAAKK
jgi:preprotein translocase subunit YajC